MELQESGEMYLETILKLSIEKNLVRAIDVSKTMNFSKPAVSRAMAKLKDGNYILIDSNGYIALTEKGRQIAEKIYERHMILTKCLEDLGVDHEIAANDACKIEHVICDETFAAIKKHFKI